MRSEVDIIVEDHREYGNLDGLIYMMGMKHPNLFLPLYIGKAETLGRGDKNFSANLANLSRDTSKFARWGDGYAYHIGDLSGCALLGHPPDKQTDKYRDWASALFLQVPTHRPVLREQVWFWAKAWDKRWSGVWKELGPTRLAFLEYTLIGVASMISTNLLNRRDGSAPSDALYTPELHFSFGQSFKNGKLITNSLPCCLANCFCSSLDARYRLFSGCTCCVTSDDCKCAAGLDSA